MRIKRGFKARRRRKKVLKLAKGYRGGRSKLRPCFLSAREAPWSITRRPAGVGPAKIHRLRLSTELTVVGKRVPSASPWIRRSG